MKFGWDAKGKWLLTRLSPEGSCVLRNTETLYGRGLVQTGYRRVPNIHFVRIQVIQHTTEERQVYTGVPDIHFLQTQVIQHKTKKQAGLKLALVSSQG